MNDDELRNRLARLDPQADAPVDPVTSPRAQDLLERSMTSTDTVADSPAGAPRNRRPLTMVAAAAVAVAGITAAAVMSSGDSKSTTPVAKKSTVTLTAPAGGDAMAMCMMFDVENLKKAPVAFAGTVTEVAAGAVTLDVTKWYKGGTADQVSVTTTDNQTAALDGVDFVEGKSFLVSADQGAVSTCGYSGPDEPTLRKAFEEAFTS